MAKHRRKAHRKSHKRGGASQRAKFGRAAKVCWEEIASGKYAGNRRPAKMFGKCMKAEMR